MVPKDRKDRFNNPSKRNLKYSRRCKIPLCNGFEISLTWTLFEQIFPSPFSLTTSSVGFPIMLSASVVVAGVETMAEYAERALTPSSSASERPSLKPLPILPMLCGISGTVEEHSGIYVSSLFIIVRRNMFVNKEKQVEVIPIEKKNGVLALIQGYPSILQWNC